MKSNNVLRAAGVLTLCALAVACGGTRETKPDKVTLIAYDSFITTDGVFDEFTRDTGYDVEVVTGGDAGELLAKAAVSAGNPEGDVLWGIDNTLLARATDADIYDGEPTAVDTGDVCLNVDTDWFASHSIAVPTGLDDLVKPEYKNLTVVPSAVTSSPGLAFLLASIAQYGDGWQDWWRAFVSNGALIVDGWTRAYTVEFSGSTGAGDYPIVVSYGTSPPAEVIFADPPVESPGTAVVESGCFHQVEYAGVLRGTSNPDGAQQLVEYLTGKTFQSDIALNMFVYPVNPDVELPDVFTRFAVKPTNSLTIDPEVIADNQQTWLEQWLAIVG